ncbi:MAG TPA: GYF domain-containing protein [Pirellulales bacterium]|nr:GYF domain-containing protein [Pirellulales bacterium]
MGIKFTCPACGRALNVKSELAGKKGRCPRCDAKIDIPAESSPWAKPAGGTRQTTAAPAAPGSVPAAPSAPITGGAASPVAAAHQAPGGGLIAGDEPTTIYQPQAVAAAGPVAAVDPIAESPQMQWYVTPPGATSQYGPASGEEFRGWIQEGRVTADSLVWRQDWPDWRPASTVFPQLPSLSVGPAPAAAPSMPPPASMPLPTAAPAMPMATAPMAAPLSAPAMAQPAFPVAAAAPGMFPVAAVAAPAADGFPIAAAPPATTRGSPARGRGYRQRSNTGPIVAIVVLLLAMIPLSFLVWKVVSEQIVSPPPAADATAGPKPPEE